MHSLKQYNLNPKKKRVPKIFFHIFHRVECGVTGATRKPPSTHFAVGFSYDQMGRARQGFQMERCLYSLLERVEAIGRKTYR